MRRCNLRADALIFFALRGKLQLFFRVKQRKERTSTRAQSSEGEPLHSIPKSPSHRRKVAGKVAMIAAKHRC